MMRLTYALVTAVALAALASDPIQATITQEAKKADLTFEIFKDKAEEYRWRLKASNGRTIAMSDEGYTTKGACKKGIELIKEGAAKALVEDHTADTK